MTERTASTEVLPELLLNETCEGIYAVDLDGNCTSRIVRACGCPDSTVERQKHRLSDRHRYAGGGVCSEEEGHMVRFANVLVALSIAAAACTTSATDDTVSNQGSTISGPPPTATSTTTDAPSTTSTAVGPGEYHLDDRSTITQDGTGTRFTTTLGNRIELHLGTCWLWSEPQITGPAQLVQINYVTDPGFTAWEILIEGTGEIKITATGTASSSGDCGSQDQDFEVSIDVSSD